MVNKHVKFHEDLVYKDLYKKSENQLVASEKGISSKTKVITELKSVVGNKQKVTLS